MTITLLTNCINNNTSILMRVHSIHSFIRALCPATRLIHPHVFTDNNLQDNWVIVLAVIIINSSFNRHANGVVCAVDHTDNTRKPVRCLVQFTLFLALFSYQPCHKLRQHVICDKPRHVSDGATIVFSAMSNVSAMAAYLSRLPLYQNTSHVPFIHCLRR